MYSKLSYEEIEEVVRKVFEKAYNDPNNVLSSLSMRGPGALELFDKEMKRAAKELYGKMGKKDGPEKGK